MMSEHYKRPWYKWYPRDWAANMIVRGMSYEEKGVYRDLLDLQWMEGEIPDDKEKLRNILGLTIKRFEAIWKTVGPCFKSTGRGTLQHHKIEAVRSEMIENSEKKQRSGAMGGKKKSETLGAKTNPQNAYLSTSDPSNATILLDVCSSKALAKSYHADADADIDVDVDPQQDKKSLSHAPEAIDWSDVVEVMGSESGLPAERPAGAVAQMALLENPKITSATKSLDNSADSKAWESEYLPAQVKRDWTLDAVEFDKLVCTFIAMFGNIKDPEKIKKARPYFSDTLAAMRGRRGVTVLNAWKAFQDCRKARNGAPLFGAQAKLAISYLPEPAPMQKGSHANSSTTEKVERGWLYEPGKGREVAKPAVKYNSGKLIGFSNCAPPCFERGEALAWINKGVVPPSYQGQEIATNQVSA